MTYVAESALGKDPATVLPSSWLIDDLNRFWPMKLAADMSSNPIRRLQVVLSSKRPVRESRLVSRLSPEA